jgi:hypothetical protein
MSKTILPRTCELAEDYEAFLKYWKDALQKGDLETKLLEEQRLLCPDYCTKVKYEVIKVETAGPASSNPAATFQGVEMLDQDLFVWRWNVVLATRLVTTVTQYFSYDLAQFMAELCGTWGLFLGASLVTVFECIDKLYDRILLK